ncbi:MAG: divergent polysaccharide deacetylase family protein, partial [Pseudomonadota bacterium]
VDVIADTGHGLITFPRGLNTAFQSAEREGVPAGLVFRDIDGTGQSADQIARALDRAAFRARPEEAIILVGRTTAETISALTEWSQGSRGQSVTLAPISVALDP